ncbi:MAG: class I SAM-dependent methyltransferase [Clostridia bacterium]|nr:class I SAM-dependent methyltransferase [Clostridia bacterium]
MNIAKKWEDYKIIDMANGQKLEKWGDYILSRPDPQIVWKNKSYPEEWKKANAIYSRSKTGGGNWDYKKKLPAAWQIKYKDLTFNIKPMGFKHTGLFPEQAVNWDWMRNKIENAKIDNRSRKETERRESKAKDFKTEESQREIKVLNLFAYTGGATVACLAAGASVCHVDSSKGMVTWAKENVTSSGLAEKKVRYIVDDVVKFVNREIRRGNKYDAIIMDPPSYGRGANGEVWQFENNIYDLVELCTKVLSDNPLFFLINSYTTGISSSVLANILNLTVAKKYKGKVESGEIGLPMENSSLVLPAGIFGRWEEVTFGDGGKK